MFERRAGADVLSDWAARASRCKGTVMKRVLRLVRRFPRDVAGQDLTEYALLITLIALAAVGAVGLASGQINAFFSALRIPLPAA